MVSSMREVNGMDEKILAVQRMQDYIAAHYREEIRTNLARLLAMEKEHVNIKATTEEGLGFTGRLEGIKACVIATCEAPYE